ncbi:MULTISPECIES: phosphate acyltransferase PlsX [unclassified Lactococcus]|uniref:phosphate acyltransferase PlsX n=1 Tax=unclassified Lactococcus TaxID=2643510 RepID=UPI0011C701C9|nr:MULTISPECIES: phosphate acyltransferase PlsX [unclassified Lactococcus]MQW22710.1 phosphate acyltransferase PlsX [Lactococcus sp. dk101]TXK44717.1 phosphate acyltransferase PlsX [Lactococcus sp. dk310]TXK50611.1 phosphate acyltransferase PlsX [Lactococcus sp. dk322]
MKIAIDAMGGDFAPENIVKGVNEAKKLYPDLEFMLFGDGQKIRQYLQDENQVEIVETTEIIDFHDDPVTAIKAKKDSSLVRAITAVKKGEADAVLSAGSTGALLTGGLMLIKRIKKVSRPALMSTLPTADGKGFEMLDLGANTENTAQHLVDFAILGSYYAENVRGVTKPRVALLSNGAEESKGSPMIKEAHEILSAMTDINFIGNIESRDILTGAADVVVADGFTGNAVLKAIEGTASLLMKQIKSAIMGGSLTTKIGGALIKKPLSGLKDMLSTDAAGGAAFIGLKAPVIKAHGNSSAEAITSAIGQIHRMLASDVTGKLVQHFENREE